MRGVVLHIRSLPGVFSYDKLDDGTRLLIDHLEVPTGAPGAGFWLWLRGSSVYRGSVRGCPCGYGGRSSRCGGMRQENIRLNGLPAAQAFPGDVWLGARPAL